MREKKKGRDEANDIHVFRFLSVLGVALIVLIDGKWIRAVF